MTKASNRTAAARKIVAVLSAFVLFLTFFLPATDVGAEQEVFVPSVQAVAAEAEPEPESFVPPVQTIAVGVIEPQPVELVVDYTMGDSLREDYIWPLPDAIPVSTGGGGGSVGSGRAYYPPFNYANFNGSGADALPYYLATYPNVKAWLKIPNTNINYPVVQSTLNNVYYTSLGYDLRYSYYGVIWAESRARFGDRNNMSKNTVLFGHNWSNISANPRIGNANDIMFAQLTAFQHLSFAQATPYIYLTTPEETMVFKVFCVAYVEDTIFYLTPDPEDANFLWMINELRARSIHNYEVDVTYTDKLLGLSTCTRAYGRRADQRFIVFGRLLRPGETIAPVNVVSNPSFKPPQFRY